MKDIVMVAGMGKSGISAAELILNIGGRVLLYDSNETLDCETLLSKFDEESVKNINVKLGKLNEDDIRDIRICVMSPGISLETDFVKLLMDHRVQLWSEIQLAYFVAKGRLMAITGTNGKTTTTALLGEIMKRKYENCFVAGNIGIPYTQVALHTDDKSMTVLEVSSFQLETIIDFKPNVSAILNITPDHLNRHHTFENYSAIKKEICMNQTAQDYCILNYDDEQLREFGDSGECKAKVVFFSVKNKLKEGVYIEDNKVYYSNISKTVEVLSLANVQLLGKHNHENICAAVAMAFVEGVGVDDIREACYEFKAVEHRVEFVKERYGVKYYNDSKATNPDAAIQGLNAMPGPTILIAGGYDKQSEYDEWAKLFKGKLKYLVLIGSTRDKIAECAKKYGFNNIMYAETLQEAVRVCDSYADRGDYVLLSPACASWGMFDNYEQRGDIFKSCVQAL
ncbi:MAG: UDP-N-acetylmuramoyl-L-alanine--D-glutamate ligase [Lachnospiraceae bacterium]|jgi:UDP-N-acetylmuramoyl-L-alanine--D-glutamate ligase|nr:MAG: UDP-N-acetylmuramoyl-L-alanine--D-glutamate ligase [Lachnospiraceae bacterium]